MICKIEAQLKGYNTIFMLDKFAVTKCTTPLYEESYFFLDFAHLVIQVPKPFQKDILSHAGMAITLIMTWEFFTFLKQRTFQVSQKRFILGFTNF